jgi:hypothetical protein
MCTGIGTVPPGTIVPRTWTARTKNTTHSAASERKSSGRGGLSDTHSVECALCSVSYACVCGRQGPRTKRKS